jgi:hypothetical protein
MAWKNFGSNKQKDFAKKAKKWFDEHNRNLDENWNNMRQEHE